MHPLTSLIHPPDHNHDPPPSGGNSYTMAVCSIRLTHPSRQYETGWWRPYCLFITSSCQHRSRQLEEVKRRDCMCQPHELENQSEGSESAEMDSPAGRLLDQQLGDSVCQP
ncbi:hypothetical protein RRG08_051865 [Elysia crispata]|uniref:Uncharacterized protein n=1 Tax=Elysia crispata TaxID=231223 RepID=A0AAE1DCA9_9GAST|nr:hypothetical protein RRG08_051865 [Elysia crispata]